jgi:hypothetical protein
VSQEKDGLAGASGEVNAHMVTEPAVALEMCSSAEGFKLCAKNLSETVGCLFVVAGGFDLDQLPDGRSHLVLVFLEMA